MGLKIGDQLPDFNLIGVDDKKYSLDSFKDSKLLAVIFSCNHCPYVIAYEDRIIQIQKDYKDKGVSLVALNANNEVSHPQDSFPNMKVRAKDKAFNFPYLRDESQNSAKAYGARNTPEIFLAGEDRRLAYHGRIDDRYDDPKKVKSQDLRNAIDSLLAGKEIKVKNTEPVGCTIKWK